MKELTMKFAHMLPVMATALSFALATATLAADEHNVTNSLTLNGQPLGLHGVDPVSMFEADAPKQGEAGFTSSFDGVDYYFADAASKAAFDADPASYLPQFGGFCAFGVFVGKKLDGDVRYADVVDGQLYLFVNAAIFEKYLEDKQAVISGAHAKWGEIEHSPVGAL